MNIPNNNPLGFATLIAVLGMMLAGRVSAQTLTTLHNFTGSKDGAWPHDGLNLSGNTLYGTASAGGSAGNGSVFAVNTDGTGFTNLHSFTAYAGSPAANSDGASPQCGLILSGKFLYGTTSKGGTSGSGTVFKLTIDGTGFTTLHSFTALNDLTNSDGAEPQAGLILSGDILYGTTSKGGSSGKGTVFALNINGKGFKNLHCLTGRKDGATPLAGLYLSGDTLYGTASFGGGGLGGGTVFALKPDGTGFKNLHTFTGDDGAMPLAGLILSGETMYGTTSAGGNSKGGSNNGIVFKLNTNAPASIRRDLRLRVYGATLHTSIIGSVITILHSFTDFKPVPPYINSDGARPWAELILSSNTLYGTTSQAGSSGAGTVFAVNTDGTSFTNLYSFTGSKDGASPRGGLILSGNTLYGTTQLGGSNGYGTVFSLSLPAL